MNCPKMADYPMKKYYWSFKNITVDNFNKFDFVKVA